MIPGPGSAVVRAAYARSEAAISRNPDRLAISQVVSLRPI
jgi:hypothetical protein